MLFLNRLQNVGKLRSVSLPRRIDHPVFQGRKILKRYAWLRKVLAGYDDLFLASNDVRSENRFLYGNADTIIDLAAKIFRKATVCIAHVPVLLSVGGEFQHVQFAHVNDGNLVAVRAGIGLFPLLQVRKINVCHQLFSPEAQILLPEVPGLFGADDLLDLRDVNTGLQVAEVAVPIKIFLASCELRLTFFHRLDRFLQKRREVNLKTGKIHGDPGTGLHRIGWVHQRLHFTVHHTVRPETPLLTHDETRELFSHFFDEKGKNRIHETYKLVTDTNERIAYLRSKAIGLLVEECVHVFIAHEEEILSGTFEESLIDHMRSPLKEAYQLCSATAFAKIYRSSYEIGRAHV